MTGRYKQLLRKERNKNKEKEEKHNIQRFTGALPDRCTHISYATASVCRWKQANQYDIKRISKNNILYIMFNFMEDIFILGKNNQSYTFREIISRNVYFFFEKISKKTRTRLQKICESLEIFP